MVVIMKFEPLMRLSVEGQDWSWILWHWRTDIRESHYMWKDLEISSLCPSALGTTFLYHCTEKPANLGARTWKRNDCLCFSWISPGTVFIEYWTLIQFLLLLLLHSCLVGLHLVFQPWEEEGWVLRHKEFEGQMEATSQPSWPTDVLLLVPSHLCNFGLDLVGTTCTGDLSCQQQ